MAGKPEYRIEVDGEDASSAFSALLSLEINDAAGLEADSLRIKVADPQQSIAMPRRGAEIRVKLGWSAANLYDKGTYVVDEIEHEGPPDAMVIIASSADFREGFKEKRSRSFSDTTLGDVINQIATDYQLNAGIDDALASQSIPHIDQTDESDGNLLARLGVRYDALASVKNGHLVFLPLGSNRSASGAALDLATLSRAEVTRHKFRQSDRVNRFTGVTASWYSSDAAASQLIEAGGFLKTDDNGNVQTYFQAATGFSGYQKNLTETFPSEQEALAAAEAEWRRLQRATAAMAITAAPGRPDLFTGAPMALQGWAEQYTQFSWFIESCRHTLDGSGLRTLCNLAVADDLS